MFYAFTYNLLLLLALYLPICFGENYYELLGVAKDANNREIRKAFKKLAVTLHPDKNQDDPDAHAKFIRITKAYETLKDEDLRKKFDLYGEEGVNNNQQHSYHSWRYYQENFGIYDDDPEIITLNAADFESSVLGSSELWFINFYSPMCSHCHTLAPAWRRLATALKEVIRIGAVNCEDDWVLCRKQNVRSYPSLIMYPSGERYDGEREEDEMTHFVLSRLRVTVSEVTGTEWDLLSSQPWLLLLCGLSPHCMGRDDRLKVAAVLEGLVSVGVVDCDTDGTLCERLGAETPAVYWEPAGPRSDGVIHRLSTLEAKEMAAEVVSLLPDVTQLTDETLQDLRTQLSLGSTESWLVYFSLGQQEEAGEELKRVRALAPGVRVGRLSCARYPHPCQQLHISRYPTVALFKAGGGYEVHHGRLAAPDVAAFARESSSATNVRVLEPDDFPPEHEAWMIDFFAPWCPPCLRLLPEFRRASRHFDSVQFGTIDCTIHSSLCRQHNVRSYPTTILFNSSARHEFHGDLSAAGLVDFVSDMLQPAVMKLTEDNFYTTVGQKSPDEVWVVDFFAPWCAPCQQLAPQWRKLAKMVSEMTNVHLGEVDCVAEPSLCTRQGVRSYPTIRLYPLGGHGLNTVAFYSGMQRDALSLRQWLFSFLPSPVERLSPDTFTSYVLNSGEPWLVDFFAPWCGPCQAFAPEFQVVAQRLKGRVRAGSLDCERHIATCQAAGVRSYPTVQLYFGPSPRLTRGYEINSQVPDQIMSSVTEFLKNHQAHDEL